MDHNKLLMTLILLNLVIGLTGGFHNAIENQNTEIEEYTLKYEAYATSFDQEDTKYGGVQTDQFIVDSTIGNSLKWGKIIVKAFTTGLNPFSIQANQYDNSMIKGLVLLLGLFRSLMYGIILLELIKLIKNKQ